MEETSFQTNTLLDAASWRAGETINLQAKDRIVPDGETVVFPLTATIRVEDLESGIYTGWIDHHGLVGLMEGLAGRADTSAFVVVAAGTALAVPLDQVRVLLDQSPDFRMALLQWLHRYAQAAHTLAASNARDPVLISVARLIADSDCAHAGSGFLMHQSDMARLLGRQRTTVCGAVQRLKALKLVRHTRGRLQVIDLDGLRLLVRSSGLRR